MSQSAFRCKTCGRLEPPESAGESSVPSACRVCGRGVVMAMTLDACLAHEHALPHREALVKIPRDTLAKHPHHGGRTIPLPFGVKMMVPENWEVLADATPDRLEELGLEPEAVVRHTPTPGGVVSTGGNQAISREMVDSPLTTDEAK